MNVEHIDPLFAVITSAVLFAVWLLQRRGVNR